MADVEDIKETLKGVEGWLRHKEGRYLYSIAKDGPGRGAVVEIGSWKGKSTIWLAKGTKEAKREKVWAIDPHSGVVERQSDERGTLEEFQDNVKRAGVEDYVIPVVKRSEEAVKGWDKPVRLLWIDGAHEYEDVKKDFLLWEPHVLEGGIVALHDTTKWPGPKRVAKEYLYKSKKFKKVGFVGSVSFGQKVAENSLADRLRNRCMLLWKDIYTLARRGRPLKPIEELVKQAFPKRG